MNRDFEKLIITMLIAAGTLGIPSLVSLISGTLPQPADVFNVISALIAIRLILAAMEMRARS